MTTKHDTGKLRWGLLPWKAAKAIVSVLTFGAVKYSPNNWRTVPDAMSRYHDAALRHIAEWSMGEMDDLESGLSHLAHAACCLLFMIELEVEARAAYRSQKEAAE